jgi:hypothetical protein
MKTFSILIGAIAALTLGFGTATADTRATYTISQIPVDKTAASTREAEAQAFAEAKVVGLRRLVAKITLPEDRSGLDNSFYSYSNANELAAAVDVDGERRSTTVYRANLSVVFNPVRVRALLKQKGVAFVDQQAGLSLMVPTSQDVLSLERWRAAWPQSDSGALNPYATGLTYYASGDGWADVSREVKAVGAGNAVIADLSGTQGSYRVTLVRVTPQGKTTLGSTNAVATLKEAVEAASAYLDETWKRQAVVRGGDNQSRTEATVRYSGLVDWNELRTALSNSPLVSEFQVQAVSREGALVSFTHSGGNERLVSELRQRGVALSDTSSGWVMELARTGRY